jgi:opacity protein-like surface antigen
MLIPIAVLTLVTIALGPSVAAAQTPAEPLPERFTISVSAGVQVFDYKEEFEGGHSEYTSVGPAWDVTASMRLAERWRINLDYLGSLISSDTETWHNVGSVGGLSVTQEDDLEVTFHVLDIDVGYSIVKQRGLEVALVGGWHFYAQDFERSNFKFLVADISFPINIRPVSEDVRGYGVKLGATVDWSMAERLTGTAGLGGYYLYQVDVDNSELGKLDSDGWAFRWKVGLDYALTPNFTLGGGYHGHYIRVDETTSSRAVLPENRTLAHTFLVRLGVRF